MRSAIAAAATRQHAAASSARSNLAVSDCGTATMPRGVVNGAAGIVVRSRSGPVAVVGMTVRAGRVVTIDLVLDPAKLGHAAAPASER